MSPESCKQLQLARSSHCLAAVGVVSYCCTWYRNIYTIWSTHSIEMCAGSCCYTSVILLFLPYVNYFVGLTVKLTPLYKINWQYCSLCVVVFWRWGSDMHFASHFTTLPLHPFTKHHYNIPYPLRKRCNLFWHFRFILYFAGFDDTTQLLRKPIRLQGNEETKPMCAKPVSMSLGMAVALHRSFERKCHLRQPNILLNNRLRLCSAVAVSNIRLRLCIVVAVLTWYINLLGLFVCV